MRIVIAVVFTLFVALPAHHSQARAQSALPEISADELVSAMSAAGGSFLDASNNARNYLKKNGVAIGAKFKLVCNVREAEFRHFVFVLRCDTKYKHEQKFYVSAPYFSEGGSEDRYFDWDDSEAMQFRHHIHDQMSSDKAVSIIGHAGSVGAMGNMIYATLQRMISINGMAVPPAQVNVPEDAYYRSYKYY